MNKNIICSLDFARTSEKDTAKHLALCALQGKKKAVFTPNFCILKEAQKSRKSLRLLKEADILLPDGIGVCLLCRIYKKSSVRRVTGIDTAYELLSACQGLGLSVFLLGAEQGSVQRARKRLCRDFPRLNICGIQHGYFDKRKSSKENQAVIKKINKASPDILFVCFGFPMQESWIIQNKSSLKSVKIFMGLGGSIDVWSGNVRRAPLPLRACGFEWLWRCILQPKRFITLFSTFFEKKVEPKNFLKS